MEGRLQLITNNTPNTSQRVALRSMRPVMCPRVPHHVMAESHKDLAGKRRAADILAAAHLPICHLPIFRVCRARRFPAGA
jgi:hypothetical protein